MIDVETLNTGVSAPIFEIGVCAFSLDERRILGGRQIYLDLLDVILKTGFLPNEDTVRWWKEQSYSPSDESNSRKSLLSGLVSLSEIVSKNLEGNGKVWANSPSFDLVLLERHYAVLSMTPPWSYRDEADFRTMRWLYREMGLPEINMPDKVAHHALSDAEAQAEHLWKIYGYVLQETSNV